MVRWTRVRWLVALLAIGIVAEGCGEPKPKQSADGTARKFKIGMVPKGANHVFWQSVRYGATKAADELGIELSWRAPLGEDDVSGQSAIVENLIIDGCDGI